MVFVFFEDGTLQVVESVEEAERRYEGVDVESEVFIFFDENGVYFKPVFTTPNRGGKFFGLISWVESGQYRLVPSPEGGKDIGEFLLEAIEPEPNPWFKSLAEVKAYLAGRSRSGGTPIGAE